MNLTHALHRNSVLFFGGFLVFAFYAFWPRYFHNPLSVLDYHVHLHSVFATTWCVMLVAQAFLIRTNQRSTHRQVGRLSFILAPLVFLSTLSAFHNVMQADGMSPHGQHLLALMIGEVILFASMYGLAMYYRDNPAVHARYMICTPLPMIGPVFNRILNFNFASQIDLLPKIDGHALPQLITVPATLMIIGALAAWDWRSHRRLDVFPAILMGFVVLEGTPFFLHLVPAWGGFVEWFLSLPLS